MTIDRTKTARQVVQEKYPGAWWCNCGCRGIYFRDKRLGGGGTSRDAWKKVAALIDGGKDG
jgi:hypothetical protein